MSLELKNVSFTYPNGLTAIENLNLKFHLGESVAIIGQNGAGKTTTVKLMNGLLRPTIGEIYYDNQNLAALSTAKIARKIGYVFQNPDDQIFQETIEKEIAFGPKIQKMAKAEWQSQVKTAAKLCGLENYLNEHPYNLSYSKRKFITIAAVIATNPDVIILDEPTAGQDKQSVELLSTIISELVKQGKLVITITHDMEFVAENFSRVLVFANHRLQKEGSPREIFWDENLLKLSHLQQPYICQLAKEFGKKDILTMSELNEVLA